MQLKQDSDYALRILLKIGNRYGDQNTAFCGMSLSELSIGTGIPRVRVERICKSLKSDSLLLEEKRVGKELRYYPAAGFEQRSLLDAIKTVERGVRLFALFDRKNELYRTAGAQLQELQDTVERAMAGITIGDLLRKENEEGVCRT